eukprot:433241_1
MFTQMNLETFPDIDEIRFKPQISFTPTQTVDTCEVHNIMNKYLNARAIYSTPTSCSSYGSDTETSQSEQHRECDYLFADNDYTDNTNSLPKYKINVPKISAQLPKLTKTRNLIELVPITPSIVSPNTPSLIIDSSSNQSSFLTESCVSLTASPSIISSLTDPSASDEPLYTPITSAHNCIEFDIQCSEHKYFMSSNGFDSGCHEWTIKILKNDQYRQEFGIISRIYENVEIGNYGGIRENIEFGNRIIYGNISERHLFYNSYYDEKNTMKYDEHLSWDYCFGAGDEIKVCLDLNKGCIQFVLNDDVAT